MNSIKTFLLLALSFGSVVAQSEESCLVRGGQVYSTVTETYVDDMDGGISLCKFNVGVDFGRSAVDFKCPIDLVDVQNVTYEDPSCSLKIGDEVNMTTDQTFSTSDMSSRGLFYWISLGGYQSNLVFPNYGK